MGKRFVGRGARLGAFVVPFAAKGRSSYIPLTEPPPARGWVHQIKRRERQLSPQTQRHTCVSIPPTRLGVSADCSDFDIARLIGIGRTNPNRIPISPVTGPARIPVD